MLQVIFLLLTLVMTEPQQRKDLSLLGVGQDFDSQCCWLGAALVLLCRVTILCIVGCFTASLASTHQMPAASCPLQLWQPKKSPDSTKCPERQNHHLLRTMDLNGEGGTCVKSIDFWIPFGRNEDIPWLVSSYQEQGSWLKGGTWASQERAESIPVHAPRVS